MSNVLWHFFDWSTPASGSKNTINVAPQGYNFYEQTGRLDSRHSANYKMISEAEKGWYSIDTGLSGSVFSDHYFDLNEKHLNQDLIQMRFKDDQIWEVKNEIMTINFGYHVDDL